MKKLRYGFKDDILRISETQKYYKRNFNNLDVLKQGCDLKAFDILILNELANYKSCNDIFTVLHRKYGKEILYKEIKSRLGFLKTKNLVSCIEADENSIKI
ncbi:hypothetical protein ES703_102401 [subsurface metagenome]